MFLYKRSFGFLPSYFYVLLLTLSFSAYSMDHFPLQGKIPSKNELAQQQQNTFDNHIRNLNANMIGCLRSLAHISPASDAKDCIDMEKGLDEFGVFLNKTDIEKDVHPLLQDSENADVYFGTMNRFQETLRLMWQVPFSTNQHVYKITDRVAKTFSEKHELFYGKYVSKEMDAKAADADNGPFPEKIKALRPLIWATTYYAPKIYIEQLTSTTSEPQNKGFNTKEETVKLTKVITQKNNIWTDNDDMKKSNFLLFYKGVDVFLTLFFENCLRMEEEKTWYGSIKNWIFGFTETVNYENNTKKDDNNTFKIAVKEKSDLLGDVVNSKDRPNTFLVAQKIIFQYLQTPVSVFPYIFKAVHDTLKRDYFKEEIDYRFYLFFNNPLHKIDFATHKDDSFDQTRSVLSCEINRFVSKLQDLEKKVEAAAAVGVKYEHTPEDVTLLGSGVNYCYILLYAQVCDTLWKTKKGVPMWDRTSNPFDFAGFNQQTMCDINYLYTLFSSKPEKN